MKLSPRLKSAFTDGRMSASDALFLAHIYSFGPSVFQVSRLLVKYGILNRLSESGEGCTVKELVQFTGLTEYSVKCLMEAALTMRVVTINEESDRYSMTKVGWCLLNEEMIRVNMNFNHDVNYEGFFKLDESFEKSYPAGLKHFGDWKTIYEGLSSLPADVQDSWFAFDHYYSDNSFDDALKIVFANNPKHLLDVGGNTGKFALRCVDHSKDVNVTICDLPQQLALMRENIKDKNGYERIRGVAVDMLCSETKLPTDVTFDAIWMSQFLDCFSEEQIVSILKKAAQVMTPDSTLYIMETLWNRQEYVPAAFCLTQISLYFTAMANGTSKMYNSDDFLALIEKSGLRVEKIHDHIGQGGHTIIVCKLV